MRMGIPIQFSISGLVVAWLLIFHVPLMAGANPESEKITGVKWTWQKTQYNNDQTSIPADPSRYTITFKTDGTINIQADCNRGGGTYSKKGKQITIKVTHTTRAMCPPDSLDRTFLKDLNTVAIYLFNDGYLYLDLKFDTGTMRFRR